MEVERFGEHSLEDWAIRMTATNLADELAHFVKPSERPYFRAALMLVSNNPDAFRRRGYSLDGARFYGHERDKHGKLVRAEASFTGRTPTDAEIESAVNAAEQAQKEQAQ